MLIKWLVPPLRTSVSISYCVIQIIDRITVTKISQKYVHVDVPVPWLSVCHRVMCSYLIRRACCQWRYNRSSQRLLQTMHRSKSQTFHWKRYCDLSILWFLMPWLLEMHGCRFCCVSWVYAGNVDIDFLIKCLRFYIFRMWTFWTVVYHIFRALAFTYDVCLSL